MQNIEAFYTFHFILDFDSEVTIPIYPNRCRPSRYGKSTFVLRLLECREKLSDIVIKNIVCCHSENNALNHMKNV